MKITFVDSGYCTVTHGILNTCSVFQAYAKGAFNQKIGRARDSASGRGPAAATTSSGSTLPSRSASSADPANPRAAAPAPGGAPSPPLAPGGASGDVSASATNNASFVGTPLHHRCHLRISLNMCHCNQAGYLTTCEDYPVWRAPVFWRTAQARCVHGCQLYSLRSSKLVLSYIVVLPVRRQPCFPT